MPSLLDLAKNLFQQGGQQVQQRVNPILQQLQGWQAQNRQSYSNFNQTHTVPLKIADPVLGFGSGVAQGLGGFTGIEQKTPFGQTYQPQTLPGKVANFAGGAVGFAMGPGKFIAPLEAGIASRVTPYLPKALPATAPIASRVANTLVRRATPAIAAEAVSSLPLSFIQSKVQNQSFPQAYGQNLAMNLAARGSIALAGEGVQLAKQGIRVSKQAAKETEKNYLENALNAGLKIERDLVNNNGIQLRNQGKYAEKVKLQTAIGDPTRVMNKELPLFRVKLPGKELELKLAPSKFLENPELTRYIKGPANESAGNLYRQAMSGGFIKPNEFISTGKSEANSLLATDLPATAPELSQSSTKLQPELSQKPEYPGTNPILTSLETTSPKSMPGDTKSQSQLPPQPTSLGLPSPPRSLMQNTGRTQQFPKSSGLKTEAPSEYFNTDRLNVPQEAKAQVQADIQAVKPQIEKIVGKTLSNKEVLQTADVTSKTLNSAVGRDQTLAWEAALLKTRQKLAELAQSGTVDQEYLDTLVQVKSLGTDIARKLQSFSIGADPKLLTSKQAILEAVLKTTQDTDAVLKAAQGVDFNNINQATNFYRQFVKPSRGEWLDLLRYNSMLSSPNTHINNISSNFQGTGIIAPIEKTITGILDAMRSALTGKPREYAVGEGAAYAKGYYSNIGNAVKNFSDVMTGKSLSQNPDVRSIPLATSKTGKAIEGTLNLPMKLLEASDQFFTALAQGGETAAQKYKQSAGISLKGLSPEEAASKRLFRSELGANQGSTLLDAMDIVANKVQSLKASDNPIVRTISKFSLPFLKTPTNILKQGVEYSLLGLGTLPGSANKTEQLSKAIIGSSIGLGVATLLGSDRLTWAEPTSEKQKQMFRAAGMQPYSVKIGDKWVSYSKLHPAISFNFALVAGVRDALDKKKITDGQAETILQGLASWLQFYADQSYMKNIGDLVSSVKGDIESPARLAVNYGTQLIPYRALLSWVERIIDPVQRQADKNGSSLQKIFQTAAAQIPGLAQTVPPRLDQNGIPIQNQNRLLNAISPARVTTEIPTKKFEYQDYQKTLKEQRDIQAMSDKLKADGAGSAQIGNTVLYVDGGEVKKIKIDQLDPNVKGLSAKTKIENLNKLVELGKIDLSQAQTLIQQLNPPKSVKIKSPPKAKKISIKSPKTKKLKLTTIKPIKLKQFKVKKLPKLKLKKRKAIKISA